ncbi:divergent protein kinase domain 2A [Chelonus insularis]|uniref:divergent protein kinase domain 2A n=1 Tax=Chelonus insularis TaxID=460826 RepID=UPI00158DC1EF|nr:divergent protein kinase domain 2A [Chelonus insularis]
MCFWFHSRFRINSLLYFILFVTLSIITNRTFNFLSPQVVDLVELSTCPICYGTTACDHIFNENLMIHPFDFHSLLSHLFNRKNVFYGTINGTRVAIKKLAHSYELDAFDDMLCQSIEFKKFCRKDQNYNNEVNSNYNIDFLGKIETAVSPKFFEDDESGLVLCPTTSHLEQVISQLKMNEIHLWTLIKINPEPLILQILQADEGWPVAKYYGACGRVVIEEYVGPPLTTYYNKPWYRRARIAINLLEAAYMFTFHNHDFSFYLTDLSSDNIAIDQNDAPKFIDLENVIILNRNISEKEKPTNWYHLHRSENIINCDDCFSFSPIDICSHSLSDHNYFATCQVSSI